MAYDVKSDANDLVDNQAESPDLIYRNGIWCKACIFPSRQRHEIANNLILDVFASNTCGYCSGTLATVYWSSSIQGPWKRQVLSGDSCNSQLEGVLPLVNPKTKETTYVWHGTSVRMLIFSLSECFLSPVSQANDSVAGGLRTGFGGHMFQPLVFNKDGSIQDLNCSPEATFDVEFTLGEGTAASGLASQSTDKSPDLASVSPFQSIPDRENLLIFLSTPLSVTRTSISFIKLGPPSVLDFSSRSPSTLLLQHKPQPWK